MDAVKTAEYTETKKLIKKYGTRDPFEIMDQMNIVVGETSRYKTLKGYCFMSCKTIYVMISSFLSEEEKMIVAAHELGHIILHRSQLKMAPMQDDTLYNMTDNTEYQANLFAADLLIEDEDIEEIGYVLSLQRLLQDWGLQGLRFYLIYCRYHFMEYLYVSLYML